MSSTPHASLPPSLPAAAAIAATSSFRGGTRENGAHHGGAPSPQSPRRHPSRSSHMTTHRRGLADELAFSAEGPLKMSPLALALQAQWRQLQQDMLSPSVLRNECSGSHTARMEEEVLQLLGSIAARADMAVTDAAHTVPYLLAMGQVPLPSVRTQIVALAALRGVFSSLSDVYGSEAAEGFVCDALLGEHQALQALSLCALVAFEGLESAAGMHGSSSATADAQRRVSPTHGSSSATAPLARRGNRSLFARGQGDAKAEGEARLASQVDPEETNATPGLFSPLIGASRFGSYIDARLDRSAVLRERVLHATLELLREVAAMCGPVSDALLSSGALLKVCMRALHKVPPPPFSADEAAGRADGVSMSSAQGISATYLHRSEDVVSLLLTLLNAEPERHNEASLVLCSYDAPRAVCALAQRLVHTPLFTAGAICEEASAADEECALMLLWSALKVLGRLTRGCPAALRLFLSENASVPAFLVQVLTVPVAEIREAGALWAAALLETQPQTSADLVHSLLDDISPLTATTALPSPEKLAAPSFSAPVPVFMASLVEMLRWRGAQMHVFGVSAILCWRWLLLSDPSRVAALLLRDSSLLATLIELILRGSAYPSSPSPAPLPTRLTALEALNVFALSYALGSLDTRARLEGNVMRGQLSQATLRRLRTVAQGILERTHPAYWNVFPAMEVELLEEATELSEKMRRAGATVRTGAANTTPEGARASGSSAPSPMHRRGSRGRLAVCISTGAAWRQLVLESMWELTAAAAVGETSSRGGSVTCGRAAAPQRQQQSSSYVSAFHPQAGVSAGGALEPSPIRVLASTSPSRAAAGTAHPVGRAVAEGIDEDGGATSLLNLSARAPLTSAPRTIREVTLLPTQQSTTAVRFRVVQQAEGLGGLFVQDSMRVVLHLAQHYTQASTQSRASFQISPNTIWTAKEGQRCDALLLRGLPGGARGSRSRSISPPLPPGLGASAIVGPPSAIFGTAPRFVDSSARIGKEPNPFVSVAKPAEVQHAQQRRRLWGVKELQREDVLLFLIHYAHLMTELPDAVAAVEDHMYYLRRQLQLCPTREVRRRCVLNDLYMNVYPKLHLFLRYINQQARRSRSVLQLISTFSGGTIHSGNVLDVYDAVGRCTGRLAVG
ncbi:hypothetical protein LSCM1_06069 [Leishmania martiniquensis]|uniref:Uncharacterized protein n=1 Tax=Leishmania martiniquensis TaxID=1580590 RepID=A0A836H6T8_9TRYP|nr:hypothetical protein LSCM1_06069 [Leishmania martiniquensis]